MRLSLWWRWTIRGSLWWISKDQLPPLTKHPLLGFWWLHGVQALRSVSPTQLAIFPCKLFLLCLCPCLMYVSDIMLLHHFATQPTLSSFGSQTFTDSFEYSLIFSWYQTLNLNVLTKNHIFFCYIFRMKLWALQYSGYGVPSSLDDF